MGLQRAKALAFRTGVDDRGVPRRRMRGTGVARSTLSGGTKATSELRYPRERVAKMIAISEHRFIQREGDIPRRGQRRPPCKEMSGYVRHS